MVFHVTWVIFTIVFRCITTNNKHANFLSITIYVYFVIFILMLIFDLTMAIVYITHIKKALTKGMIVRHSGWSVELNIKNYDDFAGYLPIIAAALWMKGLVIIGLNIYSVKKINGIRFRIKKRLVMLHVTLWSQQPLPDPMEEQHLKSNTLYYRAGETKPYVEKYPMND